MAQTPRRPTGTDENEAQRGEEAVGREEATTRGDGPEINPLAQPLQYPVLTELPHSVEFVLSEANGYLSRDTGTLADPGSVKVGQTLKITTPATATAPAVFGPNVTTDVAADGIAMYATTTNGANVNIAVLTRNAEVNGKLLYYPATLTATDKLNIAKALAVHGIVIR
jgi:hypothetical protein